MKPLKWLSSLVVEVGLKYIIKNLPPGSKKVIMPLRLAVSFCLTSILLFLVPFFHACILQSNSKYFALTAFFVACLALLLSCHTLFSFFAGEITARDPQCFWDKFKIWVQEPSWQTRHGKFVCTWSLYKLAVTACTVAQNTSSSRHKVARSLSSCQPGPF